MATTAQKELTLVRTFNAPRDLVFAAWTDPKHLAKWWGPHEFTNEDLDVDAKPGGPFNIVMVGPDGTRYPMTGTFREVIAPQRLVFFASAMDGALEDLTTVTFEDDGGKTKVTVKAVVTKATDEAAEALSGMEEGWTQSLERLEQLLAKL